MGRRGGGGLWCGVDLNLTVQADFSRLNAPGRAGCAQPGDRSDQSRVSADPHSLWSPTPIVIRDGGSHFAQLPVVVVCRLPA